MSFKKGRWKVVVLDHAHGACKVRTDDDQYGIASVHGYAGKDADEYTGKDNANLIAAAPDMYEALDFLLPIIHQARKAGVGGFEISIHMTEKALSKARGEI